jgi:hypothetical protein
VACQTFISKIHRLSLTLPGRRDKGYKIMRKSSGEQEPKSHNLFVKTDKRVGSQTLGGAESGLFNLPKGRLEGNSTGSMHMNVL